MDKIRELLNKLGSEELTKKILEAFDGHEDEIRKTLEEEYETRLKKAKEVCVEEVEAYKRELARKVQVFCESRADKIEGQIAKQVAIRESDAETKLKKIAAEVEGVELNGPSDDDVRAMQEELKSLKKQLAAISEQRNNAVNKANRAHGVAESALERNRELESKLEEAKKAKSEPIEESKKGKKDKKEVKPSKPASTRKTLKENVSKSRKGGANSEPKPKPSGFNPETIASQMDE